METPATAAIPGGQKNKSVPFFQSPLSEISDTIRAKL
jgi:hypothetical protein